jgi:nitroimidazol reductase NimA-like FMN-containing flavoprotein (pyridoxamine 5'-phosphate oxidase superfamily)
MTNAMSRAEREKFLADVHVGILSVNQPGHAPLAVPVWYSYEPGGTVSVGTSAGSRKARLITEAGRFSLCAQSEVPMYKYVSVEGPVTSTQLPMDDQERRAMAYRYLGQDVGDLYLEATEGDAESQVVFRMNPELWLTADFNKGL